MKNDCMHFYMRFQIINFISLIIEFLFRCFTDKRVNVKNIPNDKVVDTIFNGV